MLYALDDCCILTTTCSWGSDALPLVQPPGAPVALGQVSSLVLSGAGLLGAGEAAAFHEPTVKLLSAACSLLLGRGTK